MPESGEIDHVPLPQTPVLRSYFRSPHHIRVPSLFVPPLATFNTLLSAKNPGHARITSWTAAHCELLWCDTINDPNLRYTHLLQELSKAGKYLEATSATEKKRKDRPHSRFLG